MEVVSKENLLAWAEEYAKCTVGAEHVAAMKFVKKINEEKSLWIGIDLSNKECEVIEDA
jgi:hypothetical protein